MWAVGPFWQTMLLICPLPAIVFRPIVAQRATSSAVLSSHARLAAIPAVERGRRRYHKCMRFGGRVFLLISLVVAPAGLAADAHKYLQKAAAAYRHLKSLQVDATTERVQDVDGKHAQLQVRIALYTSGSRRIRIDTKDSDNSARSVLLSDGEKVTEFRAWSNEYASTSETRLDIGFSPQRGVGLGEMTYDRIAEGISKAVLRGYQTLELGKDRVSCAVV